MRDQARGEQHQLGQGLRAGAELKSNCFQEWTMRIDSHRHLSGGEKRSKRGLHRFHVLNELRFAAALQVVSIKSILTDHRLKLVNHRRWMSQFKECRSCTSRFKRTLNFKPVLNVQTHFLDSSQVRHTHQFLRCAVFADCFQTEVGAFEKILAVCDEWWPALVFHRLSI